jgi:hypothetical protein
MADAVLPVQMIAYRQNDVTCLLIDTDNIDYFFLVNGQDILLVLRCRVPGGTGAFQ